MKVGQLKLTCSSEPVRGTPSSFSWSPEGVKIEETVSARGVNFCTAIRTS